MIINGKTLLEMAPIRDMLDCKVQAVPTSYGLTECGYDIRIKEDIFFDPQFKMAYVDDEPYPCVLTDGGYEKGGKQDRGRCVLASSIEFFDLPSILMGRVLNKSTWARQFVDASLTTNIEPGWRGHLTIELVFSGEKEVRIPAGSGICQVIFERILNSAQYEGKYQDQEDRPVEAKLWNGRSSTLKNELAVGSTTSGNCEHIWVQSIPNSQMYCAICELKAEDMLEGD